MTSRYDLLDQYIDARNAGNAPRDQYSDDPELARLVETIEMIDVDETVVVSETIEWPDRDFPSRMAQHLSDAMSPADGANRGGSVVDLGDDSATSGMTAPASPSRPQSHERRGLLWYARQFAGMAAAAIVVAIFAGGLALLLGSLGDGSQPGAALVEPGEIPGTILYVEYDGDQTIARIDADGTNQQDVATRHSPSPLTAGVAWSPDGVSIAYFTDQGSERGSSAEVAIIDLESKESQAFTLPSVDIMMQLDASLDWSPNGQSLAITYVNEDQDRFQFATIHLQTGELRELPLGEGTPRRHYFHPRWSPDGQRVAFNRTDPDDLRRGIYVITYGDTRERLVVEDRLALHPSWSPDGQRLAYIGDPNESGQANVQVVDLRSGHTTRVTNDNREDVYPRWSSRDLIAFMSGFGDGSTDIFVVHPDGSGLRNLTEDYDWRVFQPDWSSDGRFLTFTSTNEDETRWRLNVYDIEADELYTVIERENPLHHAQWRPDPDHIDSSREIDMQDVNINLSDEQIELIQRSVEQFVAEDDTPAVRVNDDVVTAEQIAHQLEVARETRAAQDEIYHMDQLPSDVRNYRESIEDLYQETGLENVVLGQLLASSALRQWAEQEGLSATQEQIDEEVERQRELYEQMREQVPDDQQLPQDIIIDAIGEDRYWDEYLPETFRWSLTESNVDRALLDDAEFDYDGHYPSTVQRDLLQAEFRADLIRDAGIELLDPDALSDADLDAAIEFVTETYPEFLRAQLDEHPGPDAEEDPATSMLDDARISTPENAREWLKQTLEHYELSYEVVSVDLVTVAEMEAQRGPRPDLTDKDALVWRVEIFGDRIPVPGTCRFQGEECWDEQVATAAWFAAQDGATFGYSGANTRRSTTTVETR